MHDRRSSQNLAAYELEWAQHDNLNPLDNISKPVSDPATAGASRLLDLNQAYTFHTGYVVLSMAYANCYKVMLENCIAPLWCVKAVSTGLQPYGAKELNTIPEGAKVIIMVHPKNRTLGIILGIIPEFLTNPGVGLSDAIAQSSRSGITIDSLYSSILQFKRNGGVTNYSAGRPTDSVPFGEAGWMTETGIALFIDPFMTYMRLDEANGFFCFLEDGPLIRIAGTNVQFRTDGEEWEWLNSYNEVIKFGGKTPFFWEAKGAANYSQTVYALQDDDVTQITAPEYAGTEPLYNDQQPIFRIQDFDGYLGQGGRRQVLLPDPTETVNRYQDTPNRIGVFDESISLTGRYSLISAKALHIGKRALIPSPKMIRRPEDSSADTYINYKPSGLFGNGPDHVVKGELSTTETSISRGLVTAAGLLDLHSYLYNWEKQHPFIYHTELFYLPEEGEQSPLSTLMTTPAYTALVTNQYLDTPSPITATVDHRYTTAKYWQNESYIDFLDEGGVSIGDGYGSEIVMTNGNIRISCPGDVILEPGRNLITLAGRDILEKARGSFELSATLGSGRIKAEENLFMLGGNEESNGGVLIENRSPCQTFDYTNPGDDTVSSGVVIKSTSNIFVDGRQISINSRGNAADNVEPAIYLRAETGRIKTIADFHERFIGSAGLDIFKVSGTYSKINEWWSNKALINSPLRINGMTEINSCLAIYGWLYSSEHIATAQANNCWGGKVAQLSPANVTKIDTDITSFGTRVTYLHDTLAPQERDDLLLTQLSTDADWGKAAFSFRTSDQYKAVSFYLFENRWQQLARLDSVSLPVWDEAFVAFPGNITKTMPYPGYERIVQSCYKLIGQTMYDSTANTSKERSDAAYQTPSYGTVTVRPFDGNYPVTG